MMRSVFSILTGALAALCLASMGCSPDNPAAPEVVTNADAIRISALGNNFSAGFINGGLIQAGQIASFPNLISIQAGGGSLQMPLVNSPGIGSTPGHGALYVNGQGLIVADNVVNPAALLLNATYPVPYDNLGVPGATTLDLLQATDAASSQSQTNSFFDLILRNAGLPPGGQTAIDQVRALSPQVLTLWTGQNHILAGAMSGEPESGINITPASLWSGLFLMVLDEVESMEAPIVVVGNLPDFCNLPYFTTMPLGTMIDSSTIRWNMEEDLDGDGDDVEYILLTARLTPDYLPDSSGASQDTLSAALTLTGEEAALIRESVDGFNSIIAAETEARGWAMADVHTILSQLPGEPIPENFAFPNAIFPWLVNSQTGIPFQNTMSAYSLDGIHSSEKGQALIANAFIEALNETYGLSIPLVDVAAVENVVGFEQAPGKASHYGFRDSGLDQLKDFSSLLKKSE